MSTFESVLFSFDFLPFLSGWKLLHFWLYFDCIWNLFSKWNNYSHKVEIISSWVSLAIYIFTWLSTLSYFRCMTSRSSLAYSVIVDEWWCLSVANIIQQCVWQSNDTFHWFFFAQIKVEKFSVVLGEFNEDVSNFVANNVLLFCTSCTQCCIIFSIVMSCHQKTFDFILSKILAKILQKKTQNFD